MTHPTTSSLANKEQTVARDWFAPAILADGHVADSLNQLIADLDAKQVFAKALRFNLWELSRVSGRDSLTSLKTELKEFERTLAFRLGMLSPDREAPWFRPLLGDKFGPFQAAMLKEPMLGKYDVERIDAVRSAIVSAWNKSDPTVLYFKDAGPTLWHRLLEIAAHWQALMSLQVGERELRLDQLPDELPLVFDSRMLRAFLVNVRSEALNARHHLDQLYNKLLAACETLWAAQQVRHATKSQNPYHSTAERVRAEMRERRQSAKAKPIISVNEMQALRFMGFSDLPEETALKKRYHELAKRMHPDCHGGSEESFKMLTKAYHDLSVRVSRVSGTVSSS